MVRESDWFKCYSKSWRNEITPEAFSHPAKFARGLIRRIYEHALECGYLREGQTVLDPFGGIALGAADALANGLNFVGVELEQFFVDLGAGCDCAGISKADWVACFGRWKRFAYTDGRHWCPRCLAEAERIIAPRPPTLPGMGLGPTISYGRNSGKVPHTEPHYYSGNLDLFARYARNGATAVLLQGDSRRLVEVLGRARAQGIISSPPYSKSLTGGGEAIQPRAGDVRKYARKMTLDESYGTSPAQLGNMPTGEPPQCILSSPPYATQTVHDRCDIDPDKLTGNPPGPHSQALTMANYGDSRGQLGAMPTGEPPQAIIGSPPYTGNGVGHDAGHPRLDAVEDARREAEGYGRRPAYGESNGQLAQMREGEPPAGIVQVDACVSSPPYECTRTIPGDDESEVARGYGDSTGRERTQEAQNTFWSAALAILLQCHAVLAPGGVAIWVLKAFVRNKKIVDFPGQWEALCNSCGFETIEVIRTHLVEDRGEQFALNGDLIKRKVRRFSFFRRLHVKKYPHLAINWEIVLITRKGKA